MLRAITADAEVRRLHRCPSLGPYSLAIPFPALGDRIPEENELSFPLFGNRVEGLVALHPAFVTRDWLESEFASGLGESETGESDEREQGVFHG